VSAYEAAAQVLDPGYGIGGSATGSRPAAHGPRGRPDARHLYPILRCRDGWVRVCVLSARQWAGMFRWLGESADLADPALASIAERHARAAVLLAAYEKLFAALSRAEAVAQGQRHGVPTAAVLTLAEAARGEHFGARQAFTRLRGITVPNGLVEIDGQRAGLRGPAPGVGEHTAEVLAELTSPRQEPPASAPQTTARPLDGIRVLDLGVIVVGAELGRLLGDLGPFAASGVLGPDGKLKVNIGGGQLSAYYLWGMTPLSEAVIQARGQAGRRQVPDHDLVLVSGDGGVLDHHSTLVLATAG
jgi:crotonobetainyl-CoA:carnitine CoA-transferase CaiB-like acyl-CoA transferase